MKRQFSATVVGISPTNTSDFSGGAHTATMTLDGQGPCAATPKNVEFPIFGAEEARELGSLYRMNHAVLVTFETLGVPDVERGKTMPGYPTRCCWKNGVVCDNGTDWNFCPFCGAKLPEVA